MKNVIKTTTTSTRGKPEQMEGKLLNNEVLDTSKIAICFNFHKSYLFLEVGKITEELTHQALGHSMALADENLKCQLKKLQSFCR